MIKKLIGGILVIGVIGVVLGGGSDDTPTTSSEPVQETSRCVNAPSELLNTISEGDGFQLKNGKAVKSSAFAQAYYVSAEFTNSGNLGIDGEVGTWLVAGELNDYSYIEGVGGYGEEYSSWGSNITDKQGSAYDDGYSESRDCVK